MVQERPLLWDPTHRDYKNKDQRVQIWTEIDIVSWGLRGLVVRHTPFMPEVLGSNPGGAGMY